MCLQGAQNFPAINSFLNKNVPFTVGMGATLPESFSEGVVVNLQFGDLKKKDDETS